MSAEPMKRTECPICDKWVEDYAPGYSYVTVDGIAYHPACRIDLLESENRRLNQLVTDIMASDEAQTSFGRSHISESGQ